MNTKVLSTSLDIPAWRSQIQGLDSQDLKSILKVILGGRRSLLEDMEGYIYCNGTEHMCAGGHCKPKWGWLTGEGGKLRMLVLFWKWWPLEWPLGAGKCISHT